MLMANLLSQDILSDPATPTTFLFVLAHKENYPHIQILVTLQTLSKQKEDVVHELEISWKMKVGDGLSRFLQIPRECWHALLLFWFRGNLGENTFVPLHPRCV